MAMMSTSVAVEQIVVVGGDTHARKGDAGLRYRLAGALRVAGAEPADLGVRVPLKGGDVLQPAPSDAAYGHAKLPIHFHRRSVRLQPDRGPRFAVP